MASVLGIADTQWLDDIVQWLNRPELLPLAILGLVLSGILVFWAARYSGEVAWLLLLAFSVTVGSRSILFPIGALLCMTLILYIGAWVGTRFELEIFERTLHGPGRVIEQALYGVTLWVLTPFAPVLRLIDGVLDRVTFEHREVPVASGAVPIPETENIPVQR